MILDKNKQPVFKDNVVVEYVKKTGKYVTEVSGIDTVLDGAKGALNSALDVGGKITSTVASGVSNLFFYLAIGAALGIFIKIATS